ncbi:MAG: tetratricopeptide repeat protein [Verrucomicrobiota bacterium]
MALLVGLVFGRTVRYDFLNYDDNVYVYENPYVTQGLTWHGVGSILTHPDGPDEWLPLTALTRMLDWQLYGAKAGGHHLTNVLLHTATVILLFLVLRQTTGTLWRSAFVAAVFAIHPLRVESVAWVTERKDVLSGVFFMLTLWTYGRYAQESAVHGPASMAHPDIRCRGSRDYWLAVVFFALGLLSKTMLVTLPFVLLLLDYWPLQRFNTSPRHPMSGLLVEKIPFFVLSVAACVATAVAQEHLILKVQGLSLSIPWRVGNAIMAYADYLGHMVYPVGLALIYPHPVGRMPVGRIAFSAVLLLIITAGVVAGRRKHRYLLTGWFWYLVMLLPVIDISQEVDSARADRYTYLPQIGLYIMVTWGAVALCGAWRWRRVALGWAATAVLAGLTAGAYVQTGYWKNSATLWAHTVACTSDNAVAEDSLGSALLAQGQRVEAIQHYQRAVALKPDRPVFHFNLAIALARQGHVAEAIQHYEQALQLKPDYPQAHLNLGNALAGQGKLADAIQQYQRALELHADYVDAHYSLGNALLQQGKPAEAIQQYERALELDPNNTQVEVNLGNTLAQQGRLAEAIQHFQRAIQLDPNQPGIHLNLGNALAASGHLPEAIQNFEQELQIAPDFAQAHVSLGTALATQGNLGDALQHFQRALEINPNFAEAHYYSGLALAGLGKGSDAISQFQQAAELATAQGNIRLAQAARQRLQALQPALPQATKEDGR